MASRALEPRPASCGGCGLPREPRRVRLRAGASPRRRRRGRRLRLPFSGLVGRGVRVVGARAGSPRLRRVRGSASGGRLGVGSAGSPAPRLGRRRPSARLAGTSRSPARRLAAARPPREPRRVRFFVGVAALLRAVLRSPASASSSASASDSSSTARRIVRVAPRAGGLARLRRPRASASASAFCFAGAARRLLGLAPPR